MRRYQLLALAALVPALFLASCSNSLSTKTSPTASLEANMATATVMPTDTPTVVDAPPTQGTPLASTLDARRCSETVFQYTEPQFVSTVGDFSFIAMTSGSPSFGYVLPADLPTSQPYEVTASSPTWQNHRGTGAPAPTEKMVYSITVCNTGAIAHTVKAVTANVASVMPASGSRQDVGAGCDDPYPPSRGPCNGGGGANIPNSFDLTWPAILTVGATPTSVTQTQSELITPFGGVWDYLPITLLPGQGYSFQAHIPQAPAGTYTFSFGIVADSGVVMSKPSFPVFLAPNALLWSGRDCLNNTAMTSKMQPGKQYLCPHTGA